jgi:protein pelota
MKLLSKSYVKGDEGSAKLIPEESEDMWHTFNLIREGDQVTATTYRKISKDTGVGADSERIKLKLTVIVEVVEFDAEGGTIRLRGKNMTETEHVKLGAYHTLELEQQRAFTLFKTCWDALDVERVQQAIDPALSADLAVVLITEGLAHVCLVGTSTTVIRAKVESNLPRKRGAAAAGYDKAWAKFLDAVFTAVVRHVDFNTVKCMVIAGPGFAKDQFKEYLDAEAVRREIRNLIENREKVVMAHASSAYKQALKEVLSAPGIANRIKNTKAAREVAALQDFYKMMSEDASRAFYGPGHVFAAAEVGAIQTLLISDNLFRINSVEKRQRYVALVDGVVEAGGEALVFSSMHVSGEQLAQLSGIAAILRFPLDELADQDLDAPF